MNKAKQNAIWKNCTTVHRKIVMNITVKKLDRDAIREENNARDCGGGNIPHFFVYADLGFSKHQIGEIHKVDKHDRWENNGAKFEIITEDNNDIGVDAYQFKTMKQCLDKFARLATSIIEDDNKIIE